MGCLYMCATPIGNLAEMNPRCIAALTEAELICAEDTRRTLQLLNHFGIVAKKLISYHEHNKARQHEYILTALREGKNVAVASDAGYPGISDPGEELVRLAIAEGIQVVTINGANAALNALVSSGLPTGRFYFLGFLPKTKKHRLSELTQVKELATTLIVYEAPHRLKEVLKDLLAELGDRRIVIARELTKLHEEFFRGRVSEALVWANSKELRGEFVLIIASAEFSGLAVERIEITPEETVLRIPQLAAQLLAAGHDKKAAVVILAKQLNLPKKVVYNTIIKCQNEDAEN